MSGVSPQVTWELPTYRWPTWFGLAPGARSQLAQSHGSGHRTRVNAHHPAHGSDTLTTEAQCTTGASAPGTSCRRPAIPIGQREM